MISERTLGEFSFFFLRYMPLWNTQLKRILPLYQCWYEHIVYQLLPWGQWYFTPFVNSIYIKTFSWCKVNHVVCHMLNRSWHFMLMKWTMRLTILSSKFPQQSTQQRSWAVQLSFIKKCDLITNFKRQDPEYCMFIF